MSKYIINLDLHGGDFAPQSVLQGALIAQTKNPSITVSYTHRTLPTIELV